MACCKCAVDDVSPSQLGEGDLKQTSTSLRSAASDCNRLARETAQLCVSTVAKGNEVVEFGQDIKDTLVGIAANMDASALDTIRDLIDGDNVVAAKALAGEMDDMALACVKKSVEMITRMQEGIDALPDVVQRFVEHRAGRIKVSEEEKEMANVEPDIAELKKCIGAIEDLSLITAMEAGQNAFSGLAQKTDVCKTIFESIKRFADAVVTITEAFINMDVKAVVSKVKDILRCISLSNLMKQFAEQAGKLIKVIIQLFQQTSGKLGKLWSALAYAKDCLSNCVSQALSAKKLCADASDKGSTLMDKTDAIRGQLAGAKTSRSISSLSSLIRGEDIRDAIDLATDMDDLVLECTKRVASMIETTTEGYNNLPDIVTDGMPELSEAGKADDDPEPADVEEDIAELDRAREAVESADVISAVAESVDGFSGVTDKVEACKQMLMTSEGFADNSSKTIESFMGTWNLETATEKIMEMARLVRLGEMMQQFAEQTKRLLMAIIALMRAVVDKLKSLASSMPDKASEVSDSITDAVGVATSLANSLNLNCFRK